MYVYVRKLSNGDILYHTKVHHSSTRNHDYFAAKIARLNDCTWQPDESGDVLVEYRRSKNIDWLTLDGRRYTFTRIKR